MMRALLLASLLLSGCANADRRYARDDGEVGWCSATAFGLVPMILALSEVDKCSSRYLEAGYREIVR
jgi:hypothetical protein